MDQVRKGGLIKQILSHIFHAKFLASAHSSLYDFRSHDHFQSKNDEKIKLTNMWTSFSSLSLAP